mmetsp:Transcript_11666/g.37076  ORF Transcript_11666/g.37076 Transcript_11666/m.37076 type:complete len:525 (+) Transcript_11666:89-1663(+)
MVGRAFLALALPACVHGYPRALQQTQGSELQRRRGGFLRRSRYVDFDTMPQVQDEGLQEDLSGDFDPFSVLWKAALKGASAVSKAPLALPLASGALFTSTALTGAAATLAAPVVAAGAAAASAGAGTVASAAAAATLGAKTAQALIDVSDADVGVEMEELVVRRGYPVERHRVITDDGYVLGVFRIPHGRLGYEKAAADGDRRPVVLLQHGVLDSSLAFAANFANQSLAYILADAGYDVWLGNNRGNRYSKGHVSLSPLSSQFWNFSWTDMAEHDLPAEVDYVLQHTGQKRLAYVGHSEGSIQAFAAFSSNSTLASKVSVFVAMAPVAYVGNQRVMFLKAAQSLGLDRLVQILGDGLFYMNVQTANAVQPVSCRAMSSGCSFLMEVFAGKSEHLNQSRIHVYATMFPAGTSTKNVRHWVSGIKSKSFGHYDYGSARENLQHYGSASPPTFDLSKLTVPTALFSGGNDQMADAEDVHRLITEIRPGVVFKFKEVPTYAHLDFILAQDANTLLYPEVLQAIAEHSP